MSAATISHFLLLGNGNKSDLLGLDYTVLKSYPIVPLPNGANLSMAVHCSGD